MHIKLPHQLSKDAAIHKVKTMLDEARPKLGDQASIEEERWAGDTLHFAFNAQGQHISGTLLVEDKNFVIDAKLPLMLRFFEGRIQKEIEKQVAQLGH